MKDINKRQLKNKETVDNSNVYKSYRLDHDM